ncbi:MAG: DUF2252 domain-containing protein [Candidatus Nanopelagicales bacterium]|jgi:uncharacterized protein (DUF2252 family)|nr:DUF2252 domain-containing protein [Candidatus Nanopelagicales bacterium]
MPKLYTDDELTLRSFTEERPSKARRRAEGAQHRAEVPLEAHAELVLTEGRDARAILTAQEANREAALVPMRYERMSVSPFAYLRGAAAVMAADLAAGPRTSLQAQLCGDAHVANFGIFAAQDRRLVFDLNDFDETLPGPFEWDVKRLAASVAVAGRHLGLKPKRIRAATRGTVASYRETMAKLSLLTPLEVWYARIELEDLLGHLEGTSLSWDARQARKESKKATGDVAVGKLTELVDGRRRFRSKPPLLIPIHEAEHAGLTESMAKAFAEYMGSLRPDVVMLLLHYAYVDLAHKVVGVGSVGTRALVLLMVSGDGHHLVLQLKQANASVLEEHLGASRWSHHGQRVVVGQRVLQATGDPLLGWTSGTDGLHYYVRQLKDMKGGFDLELLDADDLTTYGRICGAVLARGHARAGDAATITGYLGDTDAFDAAVGSFAEQYADVTEADHGVLAAAQQAKAGA